MNSGVTITSLLRWILLPSVFVTVTVSSDTVASREKNGCNGMKKKNRQKPTLTECYKEPPSHH